MFFRRLNGKPQLIMVRQKKMMKRHFVFPAMILLFCMSGCSKPEIDFIDVRPKPTVKIQNNTLLLTGGTPRMASIGYIAPRARIEKDRIYVYGMTKMYPEAVTNQISLRGQMKPDDWKAYWVNRDGSLIEMQIEK